MGPKKILLPLLVLSVVYGLLAFSPKGWAQQASGAIVGNVTDPSGAAIPNATVTILESDKDFKRVLTSNSAGAYAAAGLLPGVYSVTAVAHGFQELVQTSVLLTVGETLRIDMHLKLGATTQQVSVQGNVPHVQTENASVSTAIVGTQVENLETNGRNVLLLTTLAPGAAPESGFGSGGEHLGHGGATTGVSFNGGRDVYSNLELDGSPDSDQGSGTNGGDVTPSMEMIQEFRISTSNYSAAEGQSGSAQIELVTKSGTNQFHGDVHEYLRNDLLDANDYFLNRQINPPGGNAPKEPLKWNIFGGTFGGPFYIPGVYKKGKTYFFYSQQFARYRQGAVISGFVPSLRMRSGDFSECDPTSGNANPIIIGQGCTLPVDPSNGLHFPGDVVPVNPNATDILNGFVPLPNNGVDGYVSSLSTPENFREESIRVDQKINDKISLFVRYTHDYDDITQVPSLWSGSNYDTTGTNQLTPATDAVLHVTDVFSPSFMSDFIMGYADDPHSYTPISGPGSPAHSVLRPSSFHMNPIFAGNASNPLLPGINVTGGLPGSFYVTSSNYPYINANPIYTWKLDNVWVHGAHTFKLGFFLEDYQKNENFGSPVQGQLTFNTASAVTTGNALADMFLGQIAQYTEGSAQVNGIAVGGYNKGHWRYALFEPYFQDDWRVNSRMTLNLGFRYYFFQNNHDVTTPTIDSNFDPSLYNPAFEAQLNAAGNLVVNPATGNVDSFENYGNGLVECGAGSIPSGCMRPRYLNFGPRFGFAWEPFKNARTVVRGGYGIYYEYGNGNDANTEGLEGNPPSALSPSGFNIIGYTNIVPGAVGPPTIGMLPPLAVYPSMQQFNLTVEHQFGGGNLLSVGYVGNVGRHLFLETNLNEVAMGAMTRTVPELAGTTGCTSQGSCNVQDILIHGIDPTIFFAPYRGYNAITDHENMGNSNYNSLQVSFRHPFGHGLTAQIAYTYAHAIDDSTNYGSDGYSVETSNMERWYATSDYNLTHTFVANYVYNLPFFRNSNYGFLKEALGGWVFSGITTFYTGPPVDYSSPSGTFNCGVSGFDTGIGTSYRCNLVGPLTVDKHVINDPQFGPVPGWFNPGVLTQPLESQLYANGEPGMFGYMGRNVLWGPGRNDWDLGLMKNFSLPWLGGEHSTLRFRVDTFNTFNHPQWQSINAGCASSIGFGQPCTQLGNAEVNSDYNPRQIQLGITFSF